MPPEAADAPVEAPEEEAGAGPAEELELLHGCPVGESHGQRVVFVNPDGYGDLMRALADDGFNLCIDVTAVDYLALGRRPLPDGIERHRFEVVVNLLDTVARRRIRVRCPVPADNPVLPSLFDVWPGADAQEREVYDMMGITFTGHPDMTRILMPDDWEGHPLRKDYTVGRIPVQFKEAPGAR